MVLRSHNFKRSLVHIILRASLALAVVGLVLVGLVGVGGQTAQAAAGINTAINFQGRLLSAAGAVVADGTYNIEFKIYQDGPGNVAADTGGTLLWTEDWVYGPGSGGGWVDNRVIVKNGYFSVNLGSICKFSSTTCTANMGNPQTNTVVTFNSDTMWLSMNVSTSTSTLATFSSGDGEMLPMKRMSSAVYAENANDLGGLTSGQYVQLAQGIQTASTSTNPAIGINVTSGSGNLVTLQSSSADVFDVTSTGNILFGNNADKTLSVTQAAASAVGNAITVTSGQGGGTGAGGAGGNLTLQGGAGGGTGAAGGNIVINAGAKTGASADGTIAVGTTHASAISIGNSGAALTVSSGGTSAWTNTSGNLTLSTATSGTLAVTSAGALNLSTTSASSSTKVSAAASATAAALVVAGGATPGAGGDLLQLQDSTGSSVLRVDSSGNSEHLGYIDSGFGGIGPYQNLLQCSEQFDAGCTGTNWSVSNLTAPTANTVVAPDGNQTAESLAETTNAGYVQQAEIASVGAGYYTFSVWLKQTSGNAATGLCIFATGGTGSPTTCTTTAVTPNSTDWQRFSVTQQITGTSTNITARILPGNGVGGPTTISAWGAQLVVGATAQPAEAYVRTTASTVGASTGVVSNGGAFVSSINLNDVPLVVQGAPSQSGDLLQLQNSSGSPLFKVSSAGAVTSVGVNSGSGIIQGSGGMTITGTTQINATTGGTTTIGSSAAGTMSIQGGSAGTTINDTAGSLTLQTTTSGAISVTSAGTLAFSSSDFVVSSAGTVTTGTWQGTAVGAQYGGTGQSVYVQGDLLYASTTTALSRLADVATGFCLASGGVGANPTWGSCSTGGIVQVPGVGVNVITPTVASSVGLTINGTSSATGAAALIVNQAGLTYDGEDINMTSTGAGPQVNGLLVNRNGSGGFTTNAINITNTLGTLTNGLAFTGTITGADINRGSGVLTLQGTGGITLTSPTATTISADTAASGGTVSLGAANATTVNLGNTGSTTTAIQGGTAINIGAGSVAGSITIGGTTTTGTITVGQADAINAINIGSVARTAHTQTITVGGGTSTTSGGVVVNIATGVPGASTTNVVHIGDTGTTTGTVAVTVGSNGAAAHVTTIQGGNGTVAGTAAIQLNSAAAGDITVGTTAQTGAIYLGQSTSGNTVNVANGNVSAGTQNVSVGAGSTSTGKDLVTVGSMNGASATTIQGGTGNVNLKTNQAGAGTLVQSVTNNSASAFQVQNAAGEQLLGVNTTNPVTDVTNNQNNNEISNGSFEGANGTTGWAAIAGATLSQTTTQADMGSDSMQVATTGTANDGAKYNLSTSTLLSNTTYVLTMNVRSFNNGGNWTTMELGYNSGSAASYCSNQTVYWYGWQQFTCTFTTGTTSGTPYIFIEQSDAAQHTFYIDGVQLQRWSILANAGVEQAVAGNWTQFGGATVTQSNTYAQAGTYSAKVVTNSGVVLEGLEQNITLTPNTLYSLYFYMNSATTLGNDFDVGYYNGSTYTPCMTKQPVTGLQWSYYDCSFTTPASNSGTPYMYIDDNSIEGSYTFYVDQVQLNEGTYLGAYEDGQVAINGTVNSPVNLENNFNSTNALQVQTAQGVQQFSVDTTNNLVSFLQEADITSAASGNPAFFLSNSLSAPTYSLRVRANSQGANFESGGVDLYLSGWSSANMTQGTDTQDIFARGSLSTGDLYVGDAAGTGNNGGPTALVLDNSSTAPAEQEGGMYFDTALHGFQCGQGGAWQSCAGGLVKDITATQGSVYFGNGGNITGTNYTMPLNDCQPGVVYQISGGGYYLPAGAAPTMYLGLWQNGSEISDGWNVVGSVSGADIQFNITMTCRTTTTVMVGGTYNFGGGSVVMIGGTAGGAMTTPVTITNISGGETLGLGVYYSGTLGTTVGGGFNLTQFVMSRNGPP